MSNDRQFLASRRRYQPVVLPQSFSDEEMARDWTFLEGDLAEINRYRKNARLFIGIQMCAVRLYGRFLADASELSPRIVSYLSKQLSLRPSLTIKPPERDATYSDQRKKILAHLNFSKYNSKTESELEHWLERHAQQGTLPDDLFLSAEQYLLSKRVTLPGPTVLERLIVRVCSVIHERIFEQLNKQISPKIKQELDAMLTPLPGEQRSLFYFLKEYPPSATIRSINDYLDRYQALLEADIDSVDSREVDPAFVNYLYRLAKRYTAKDIKRFREPKRYSETAA